MLLHVSILIEMMDLIMQILLYRSNFKQRYDDDDEPNHHHIPRIAALKHHIYVRRDIINII